MEVDWTSRFKSPIRYQVLMTCWAIAIASEIEARCNMHMVDADNFIALSSQMLIYHAELIGCSELLLIKSLKAVYQWIERNGMWLEHECPFKPVFEIKKPEITKSESSVRINGYLIEKEKDVTETKLLKLVSEHPVVAVLVCDGAFVKLKKGEIYGGPNKVKAATGASSSSKHKGKKHKGKKKKEEEEEWDESIWHAVVIVGYGITEDGQKYWKIRNSWGNWCDNGYGLVARDPPGVKSIFIEYSTVATLSYNPPNP